MIAVYLDGWDCGHHPSLTLLASFGRVLVSWRWLDKVLI